MDKQLLINILKFAPLGLFLFFIIIGLLWGLIRGFRKSLVLFIHSIVIALALLAVYEIIVNQPWLDSFIFTTSSQWVDYTGEPFYAPANASSMNEVISSAIVHNMDYGDGIALIVEDNGAYLATLANLVLHLALALVFYIVYFILIFIMYLIYLIFYPERRRARKIRRKHEQGEGKPYNRHTGLGGIVGALRGLVVSLVWFSFIGALLFIVAGTGDDRKDGYNSINTSDNKVDSFYEAFDIVNCYGSTGIFKVLNSVKDSNNVPVYLFAANLVLQGNYKAPETNESYSLYLINELNNYQEFASGVYRILIKYDTENLLANVDTHDNQAVLDAFVSIISKDGVQAEIDSLIDNFDGNSFFVNFGLSMVDSIAKNLEKLKFYNEIQDQQLKDLLHVLLTGDDAIKLSNILSKDDTKLLANAVIKALKAQNDYEGELDDQRKIILYTKAVIGDLKEMSFLKDDVKNEKTGKVLKNLYEFASTSINTEYDLTGIDLTPKQWVGELESLLDAAVPALELYDSVYVKDAEPLEIINNIFPEDNPTLAEANSARYDILLNTLSKSNLLDAVMSLSAVRKVIDDTLHNINENIELPSKIQFVDKDDQRGETYHLLTSLKQLIQTGALSSIIDLSNNQNKENLQALADKLTVKDTEGKTVVEKAVESTIVKYLISGVVLNLDVEGFEIVVPDSAVDVDAEGIRVIKQSELNNTVDALPGVLQIIKDTDNIDFAKLLEQKDELLESNIVEATLVYNLVNMLKDNEYIAIPETFSNAATKEALNDLGNNVWHTSNEISNVIDALDELLEISKATSFDFDSATQNITKNVFNLNGDSITDTSTNPETNDKYSRLDVAYRSEILKASLSKVLDDNLTDLMDPNALTRPSLTETDTYGVKYYKESEISKVLYGVSELGFDNLDAFKDENALKNILTKDLTAKGTTKFALANNYSVVQVLYSSFLVKAILTTQVDKVLTDEIVDINIRDSKLVKEIEDEIVFYKESEINSVAEIISELQVTDFDKIADTIMDVIFDLNDKANIDSELPVSEQRTKLQVLYGSNLVKSAILKQLDNNLTDELVSTNLRDSTLVKEKVDTQKLDDTAVTFYLYKESEFANIISAAEELGISSLEDFNDTSNISSKIFTLFETSTTDPSKQKIEIVYKSNIVKSVVSTQLDNNLTDTLIDPNVRDSIYVKDVIEVTKIDSSVANVYLYKDDEIKNIIDGANELDITTLNDFSDSNSIKAKVFSLSDPAKKDSSKQKIDILNESYIVRGVLAKQLDDNLGGTLIDPLLRDSKLVKDYENVEKVDGTNADISLYSTAEIKNIINAAKELDISDFDNFTNAAEIKSKILTLNATATTDPTTKKINVLYKSNIVKGVLATQLDDNLTGELIDQNLRDSALIKEVLEAEQSDGTINKIYIYQLAEISKIINAADELDIDDIDNFTNSSKIKEIMFDLDKVATTDSTKQKIDIIYASEIVRAVLTKQLDTNLDSTIIDLDVRDSNLVKEFEQTTKITDDTNLKFAFYKKSEILKVINSASELGIEDIDDFTDSSIIKSKILTLNNPATTASGKKIDVLLSSNIIKSILTSQLDNNISTSIVDLDVRDSLLVKEKNSATMIDDVVKDVYFYKDFEIKTIISSANELDISSIDDFTDSSVIKGKIFTLSNPATTDNTKKKMEVLYSSNLIKSILTKQLDANLADEIVEAKVRNSLLVKDKVEAVQLDATSKNVYLYKEAEVYGIINSAKELEINTVDDFNDSTLIKGKILSLYNQAITDDSKTKIEVMYASYIIKAAFTKQLNDNLDSTIVDPAILETRLVMHKYDTKNLLDANIVVDLYEDDEVYGIINSARELEITSIDSLNGSSVKDKILSLNSTSATDTSKSKLDILYSSYIIKAAVLKQLDTQLDSTLVDEDVRDSLLVKESFETTTLADAPTTIYLYKQEEVSTLINSASELGITTLTGFDADTVKDKLMELNATSTTDAPKTKLQVLYSSNIVKSLLTTQLDANLNDTIVDLVVRDSQLVKEVEDTYDLTDTEIKVNFYKENEIRLLIESLDELEINIGSIDAASVKNKVLGLNDISLADASKTKLEVIYESNIIKSAITKQLDNNIGDTVVSAAVKNSDAAKATSATKKLDDTNVSVKLYKLHEVSALIKSLDIIGITNLDNIDTDTVGDAVFGLNEAKLDDLYDSVIITYALSKKLNSTFESLAVNEAILADKKETTYIGFDSNYVINDNFYYNKSEVLLLINALGADGLNKTNLSDVESIEANAVLSLNEVPTGKTKTRLAVIYESDILKDIISSKLNTALNSNTEIVNDSDAKYKVLTVSVYKEEEIAALITALNHLNITDLDNVNTSSLHLSTQFKNDVEDSTILYSTISKYIIENTSLIKPTNGVIGRNGDNTISIIRREPFSGTRNEMDYILSALIELGVTDMSSTINLKLDSEIIEDVSKSIILRATISEKIVDNSALVYIADVVDYTVTGTPKDVIKEAELAAFLTAITDGFGMSNTDLASFTAADLILPAKTDDNLDAKLNVLADSVIMRATITDKIELSDSHSVDYDIKAISSNAETKLQTNTNVVVVLKKEELVNTMKGIVYLTNGGSVSAQLDINTLANLSSTELDVILNSSMFRVLTDEIIYAYVSDTSNPFYATLIAYYNGMDSEVVELLNISNHLKTNKSVLTKASEIATLAYIGTMI